MTPVLQISYQVEAYIHQYRITDIASNRVKFLIWILECNFRNHFASGKSGLDNLDINEDQTLEHILPQSCWKSKTLPSGWVWWDPAGTNVADKDDLRNYVDRLGNMCIVKKKYNSSYGNNSFSQKQNNKIGGYKKFLCSIICMVDNGGFRF